MQLLSEAHASTHSRAEIRGSSLFASETEARQCCVQKECVELAHRVSPLSTVSARFLQCRSSDGLRETWLRV